MSDLLFDNEVIGKMPDDYTSLKLLNEADNLIIKLGTIVVSTLTIFGIAPNQVPEVAELMNDSIKWLESVRVELGLPTE